MNVKGEATTAMPGDYVVLGIKVSPAPAEPSRTGRLTDVAVAALLAAMFLPVAVLISCARLLWGRPVLETEHLLHPSRGAVMVHRFHGAEGGWLERTGLRDLPALLDVVRGHLALHAGVSH